MIKCVVKLGFVSSHLHSCTLALSLFACPASTLVISSTRTPAKGPSFLPSALEEKLRRDKTTAAFSRLRITNLAFIGMGSKWCDQKGCEKPVHCFVLINSPMKFRSYLSEHSILEHDSLQNLHYHYRSCGVAPATPRWHAPHVAGLARSQCGMPWPEKACHRKNHTNLASVFTGRFLNITGFYALPVASR